MNENEMLLHRVPMPGTARAAAAASLIALLLASLGCASEVKREELPLEIDFSEGCDWPEDDDEHIFLGCESGAYHVRFKRTDERIHHVIPRRLESPAESMRLESNFRLTRYEAGEDDFELQAVACVSSGFDEPLQGYLFGIAPEIHGIAIIKVDETDESLRERFYFSPLIDEESDAVVDVGESTRITAECRPDGDAVDLMLSLDGHQVANARDPEGFAPYDGAAFIVLSTKPGTEMVYDNVTVDEAR